MVRNPKAGIAFGPVVGHPLNAPAPASGRQFEHPRVPTDGPGGPGAPRNAEKGPAVPIV